MKSLTVALIPARSGSQGIPGKNIKPLAGIPLINYTIRAALSTPTIDRVYVTTEDSGIAKVAADCGAEVLMRPPALSQNHIQTDEVFLHALRQLQLQGIEPEVLVLLQPTSPFRTSQHIERAVELYHENDGRCTIFSGYRAGGYYWGTDEDGDFFPIMHDPVHRLGRQDYNDSDWLIRENGSVYVVSAERFSEYRSYRVPPFHCLVMREDESLDLDEPKDFDMAQEMMSRRLNRE